MTCCVGWLIPVNVVSVRKLRLLLIPPHTPYSLNYYFLKKSCEKSADLPSLVRKSRATTTLSPAHVALTSARWRALSARCASCQWQPWTGGARGVDGYLCLLHLPPHPRRATRSGLRRPGVRSSGHKQPANSNGTKAESTWAAPRRTEELLTAKSLRTDYVVPVTPSSSALACRPASALLFGHRCPMDFVDTFRR